MNFNLGSGTATLDCTIGQKVFITSNGWGGSVTDGRLLDQGQAGTAYTFIISNADFTTNQGTATLSTALTSVRIAIRVFHSDTNVANDAVLSEELGTFPLASSVSAHGTSMNIVNDYKHSSTVSKRFFYYEFEVVAVSAGTQGADIVWGQKLDNTGAPLIGNLSLAGTVFTGKTRITGVGFQTYAGPHRSLKFGAENEIIGNLNIESQYSVIHQLMPQNLEFLVAPVMILIVV